jgi:hypothetical protein
VSRDVRPKLDTIHFFLLVETNHLNAIGLKIWISKTYLNFVHALVQFLLCEDRLPVGSAEL